jgi:SAM-dependent methyltransferase
VTLLFDDKLRAQRRDRAARIGPELFLLDRAFDDCLERLSLVRRSFSSALLLGCPNPAWKAHLRGICGSVEVFDPGALFATASGGGRSDEVALPVEPESFDLILAVGTLDTVNDLPGALLRLRLALHPDGLLLGAVSGGETLPRLRGAMRAADAAAGAAAAHVHPRLTPAALIGLLQSAGFTMPVVDVDRASVSYTSLRHLVADLRAMAATNVLTQRPAAPILKRGLQAAQEAFRNGAAAERTTETFEILHFAAWTPAVLAGSEHQG